MIYVTVDIHASSDLSKLNAYSFMKQRNMTKSDYVIICGDFRCGVFANAPNKVADYFKTLLLNDDKYSYFLLL